MPPNELTRRTLLVRSTATAGLGPVLPALVSPIRRTRAQSDASLPNEPSDVEALNRLLSIEHDLIEVYRRGLEVLSADASTIVQRRMVLSKLVTQLQNQHKQHASVLEARIEASVGEPVVSDEDPGLPGAYPLMPKTADFIKLAADKEKAAAVSFARAIESLVSAETARVVCAMGAVHAQRAALFWLMAEDLFVSNTNTGTKAEHVVPAAFVLDVGLQGSTNLANSTYLDQLLTLDVAP